MEVIILLCIGVVLFFGYVIYTSLKRLECDSVMYRNHCLEEELKQLREKLNNIEQLK